MKRFLHILMVIVPVVLAAVSCEKEPVDEPKKEETESGKGYDSVEELIEKLQHKDWVRTIAQANEDEFVFAQYTFDNEKEATFTLLSGWLDKEGNYDYTIDTAKADWKIVENYQSSDDANLKGDLLHLDFTDKVTMDMVVDKITADSLNVTLLGDNTITKHAFYCPKVKIAPAQKGSKATTIPATSSDDQKIDLSSWMGQVKDYMFVTDMAIPGSHDAATYGVATALEFGGKCQLGNFEEQWNSGVRVFDLRVRNSGGEDVRLYHNFIPCNLSLKEAMISITSMVEKHKTTDGAIVIISTEGNDMGALGKFSSTIAEIISWLLDKLFGIDITAHDLNERTTVGRSKTILKEFSDYLIYYRPDLTLGELRGHVTVIFRNSLIDSGENYGVTTDSWGSDTKFYGQNGQIVGYAYVQDNYGQDDDESQGVYSNEKKSDFINCWQKSMQTDRTTLFVNSVSGYHRDLDTPIPNYASVAEAIYNDLAQHIKDNPGRGIVLQDYAGVSSAARIDLKATVAIGTAMQVVPPLFDIREKAFNGAIELAKKIANKFSVNGDLVAPAVVGKNINLITHSVSVDVSDKSLGSAVIVSGLEKTSGEYYEGSSLLLRATPTIHSKFIKWKSSTGEEYDKPEWRISVTSDATYTAVFEIKKYTLTLVPDGNPGCGDPLVNGERLHWSKVFNSGDKVKIEFNPKSGYGVWLVENGKAPYIPSSSIEFTIMEDRYYYPAYTKALSESDFVPVTYNIAGKKVHFTKGNLRWDGKEFSLEKKQTDYSLNHELGDEMNDWDGCTGLFTWLCNSRSAIYNDYNQPLKEFSSEGFFANHLFTYKEKLCIALTAEQFENILDNHNPAYVEIDDNPCFVLMPEGKQIRDTYLSSSEWEEAEKQGGVCLPSCFFTEGYDWWDLQPNPISYWSTSYENYNAYMLTYDPYAYESGYFDLTEVLPTRVDEFPAAIRLVYIEN